MPTEPFQPQPFGPYLLVSQLGRGGMAEVYKARVRGAAGFERVVCVKRILRAHGEDEQFLAMFVNEAKISARLSHPNIVQVYELGEVEGEFFMAMEFVHGRDLLRVMRTNAAAGALPPGAAAYVAREMCRALAHAHDHRGDDGQPAPIIHRDVSPQNVMISFDGIVKLVDFGIAKATQAGGIGGGVEETRTGALKGKFAYMAPEQLDGQRATPLCDVFAAGVVLHEMLTGRRLFKGNTDYDTLVRVKTQPIPPPSTLVPGIAPELDAVVARALERDPLRRWPHATAMARELEGYCGRVGFASDDMKALMATLFPTREEIPDGVVTVPSNTGAAKATPGGRASTSGARAGAAEAGRASAAVGGGAGHASASAAASATGRGERGGGNGLAIGAVVVILVAGLGTAFAILRPGAASSSVGAPGAVARPAGATGQLAGAAPDAPSDPAAGSAGARTPLAEVVTVLSSPPGADVEAPGHRLLGQTPVAVRLGRGGRSVALHLSKPGYDDLDFTVGSDDAPTLTLKLQPAHRRAGGGGSTAHRPAPGAPTDAPPRAPRIQSFDDIDTAAPKVKTVDE